MGQSICSSCSTREEETLTHLNPIQNEVGQNKVKSSAISSSTKLTENDEKKVEIIEYEDGSVYTGEVIRQKKQGIGVLQNTKQFYEGEFFDDCFNGFGYIESLKKMAYTGEFVNNNKSGIGMQFSITDSYYFEGEWKNNNKNGIGKEVLPDKSEYLGEFLHGKKHGVGIYLMSNGRKYEGEFKNSKLDGYGRLICDNGDYYYGFWEENEYNGFGILCKKRQIFKGFFKKDKKHGFGIKTSFDKNSEENGILVGNWVDNNLEGTAIGINSITSKIEKIYKFSSNKIKTTTSDNDVINDKSTSNRECVNLLNFYIEYRNK